MNYAWKNFTKIKKIKIMKPFIITLAIKLFWDGRGDLDFTFYKMSIVFHCFSFRLYLISYKGERDTSKFKTFINNKHAEFCPTKYYFELQVVLNFNKGKGV